MLADEVTVEMNENLTVKDLGGTKRGILAKGNKVQGRKSMGLSGEKKGDKFGWKVGYKWRIMGNELS